jgi:hypothetical protein
VSDLLACAMILNEDRGLLTLDSVLSPVRPSLTYLKLRSQQKQRVVWCRCEDVLQTLTICAHLHMATKMSCTNYTLCHALGERTVQMITPTTSKFERFFQTHVIYRGRSSGRVPRQRQKRPAISGSMSIPPSPPHRDLYREPLNAPQRPSLNTPHRFASSCLY